MKVYSPIFHSLLYLYLSVDKETVAEKIEAHLLEKGQTLLIDHPKYSLYVVKNRACWKLESQDTFYDLAPFSITLGHQKKLLTKRVINELKVKLFRAIKEHDKLQAQQYLNYLFRQKILQLINEVSAGTSSWPLWRHQHHINLRSVDAAFCERYKFDATITIEKKFLTLVSMTLTHTYTPCQGVEEHRHFTVQGTHWNIKEKVNEHLHDHLFV